MEMKSEEKFRGIKFLVVGSGVSGISAVACLEHMGAEVVLYDSNEKLCEKDLRALLPKESKAVCVAGECPEAVLEETQTVVLSPGVPTDIPLVNRLRERDSYGREAEWLRSQAPTARPLPPPW